MTYSFHRAGPEDAPAIAEVFQKAFAGDHIMGYFHPDTPKDILLEKDIKYFTKSIGETLYGRRYTKVIDDSTGKTAAFSAWQYPHHLSPEQQTEKERAQEETQKEPHAPGAQGALLDEFFKKIFAGRKKWIDPEKTFFMHILAVHPDHQCKGLGAKLLHPGLADADKADAQTYIEASPAGLPVYLRYGWKIVDEMTIDMRPYGGHAVEHQPFLMREPHAPKQTSSSE